MYKPNPIKTDHIRLPDDLAELTEQIAAQVHDIWAQGRIAAGWVYGETRDDAKKTTPCLVPYDALPESEKDFSFRLSAYGDIVVEAEMKDGVLTKLSIIQGVNFKGGCVRIVIPLHIEIDESITYKNTERKENYTEISVEL